MHIVWLILKIIGAILGGLLGLLLLLLLLVIFVPIRYKIRLKVDKSVETDSYISWLLHIVHISIQYHEKQMKYCLRIFGIPVRKNKKENDKKAGKNKQRRKPSEKSAKQKKHTQSHVEKKQAKAETAKRTQSDAKANKTEQKTKEKANEKAKKSTASNKTVCEKRGTKYTEKGKDKKGFHPIQKIKSLIHVIREKVHHIPLICIKIKNRIIKLNQKKKKVLAFVKDEGTRSTIKKFIKRTFEILKYIAPTKLRGYIRYGTGDPCQTGQILGIISILRAYFNTKISIYPVFEEKIIEADLTAHGRMRVFRFLRVGGSLYFDKEVKKFIADGKQLKEELNG